MKFGLVDFITKRKESGNCLMELFFLVFQQTAMQEKDLAGIKMNHIQIRQRSALHSVHSVVMLSVDIAIHLPTTIISRECVRGVFYYAVAMPGGRPQGPRSPHKISQTNALFLSVFQTIWSSHKVHHICSFEAVFSQSIIWQTTVELL